MDNVKLTTDLLKVLAEHGIIKEIQLRNYLIYHEYKRLVNAGMKSKDVIEQLAEKFFLSIKAIEGIIYTKKNRTEVIIILT